MERLSHEALRMPQRRAGLQACLESGCELVLLWKIFDRYGCSECDELYWYSFWKTGKHPAAIFADSRSAM